MHFIRTGDGNHFREHHNGELGESMPHIDVEIPDKLFKNKPDAICIQLRATPTGKTLHTSYYIGVDWIDRQKTRAIYVEPKLNTGEKQTDYLAMLQTALGTPEALDYLDDLFEVKTDEKFIEIEQKQDTLTPLIVSLFLHNLKQIVRKGLMKSYYRQETDLFGKIKGKIMVGDTMKRHLSRNRPLNTRCSFEIFDVDTPENRLLKKALKFVGTYLSRQNSKVFIETCQKIVDYISPAFSKVSDSLTVNEIKHYKPNALYREYSRTIDLSVLIIKKFGYNITNIGNGTQIETPPFWIDMSKLFEMYVLGILKKEYGDALSYQFKSTSGIPDYLIKKDGCKMIVDAKYKPIYKNTWYTNRHWDYVMQDIRQLSGYARDKGIISQLGVSNETVIDCLIIYPLWPESNIIEKMDLPPPEKMEQFTGFYKLGINLPQILNKPG